MLELYGTGGVKMKNKGNNVFHSTNSQINISNDNSSLKATYINGDRLDESEKLLTSLQQLLEALKEEKNTNGSVESLATSTQEIIEDLQEDDLSERRLKRFREKLNSILPELQLGSTLCAVISAVNDAIQLYMGT